MVRALRCRELIDGTARHANMASHTAVIHDVLSSHCEEASGLWLTRARLIDAPHVTLFELQRHDERIAAHLDGVSVAGAAGLDACRRLLEEPDAGVLFLLAVRTLEDEPSRLQSLLDIAKSAPAFRAGVLAGFGWAEPGRLRGVVANLLGSPDPLHRLFGVAACSMHRVDPAIAAPQEEADASVRARLFRAAGELGQQGMLPVCARSADEDAEVQFWATWSAVLLGAGENALAKLAGIGFEGGARQAQALQLALQAANPDHGHALLQANAAEPERLRIRIKGAGCIGNPRYVPWLISQMSDDKLTRLAGESFSLITGLDLSRAPFERMPPENFESGPTEDPEDDNVAMDEDDDLPWPVQSEVQKWWDKNGARFTTGVRHFMGAPPSRAHCIEVLKNSYQRQRIAAAYHLCLLNPGTPLFEWRAPAGRQQRALAQLS